MEDSLTKMLVDPQSFIVKAKLVGPRNVLLGAFKMVTQHSCSGGRVELIGVIQRQWAGRDANMSVWTWKWACVRGLVRSINLEGFLKLLTPQTLLACLHRNASQFFYDSMVPWRTCRLRNISSNYDLVYVPVGNKRSTNLGLAFVPRLLGMVDFVEGMSVVGCCCDCIVAGVFWGQLRFCHIGQVQIWGIGKELFPRCRFDMNILVLQVCKWQLPI